MKKNPHNKNYKELKVFETFSGIGAQHKALEFLKQHYGYNYSIVATSEWDVDAVISYAAIHYPDFKKIVKIPSDKEVDEYLKKFSHSFSGKSLTPIDKILSLSKEKKDTYYQAHVITNNLGSILEIKGKDLLDKTGGVDLITYSFPCQDLSVAGSFHGFNQGMKKGSKTRSSLLWEIGRILWELKECNKLPKFLLLENVVNMVSSRHKKDYHKWLKELNAIGYQTKTFKLNAKDFGICQNRNRVYAISILTNKYKVNSEYDITDCELFNNICADKNVKPLTLKQVIKEDYSIKKYLEEAKWCTPNKTPSRKKMFDLNRKLNDFDKPKYTYSRTVTTKQDRHPNAGVVNLKNTSLETNDGMKANYRFITPRETFLLMGFSEKDYENAVKLNSIKREKLYQQAGNSIVVNVLISLMKIIQELDNE